MVAADFLQDPLVQGWLEGVEPAWTFTRSTLKIKYLHGL
jgi:hypothetical protein